MEKEMECDLCEFVSSSRKAFREHAKVHDTERPVKCPTCSYQCSSKSALKNHIRVHSSDKPYTCDFCAYSSKQNGNVKLHVKRKHSDMLWFKRKMGTKKSKSALKAEKQPISSGDEDIEEPAHPRSKFRARCKQEYACTLCSASFVRQDSLRSHVRQHREMTNSSLSTALTVLRLQQPVINAAASSTAAESDSVVVHDVDGGPGRFVHIDGGASHCVQYSTELVPHGHGQVMSTPIDVHGVNMVSMSETSGSLSGSHRRMSTEHQQVVGMSHSVSSGMGLQDIIAAANITEGAASMADNSQGEVTVPLHQPSGVNVSYAGMAPGHTSVTLTNQGCVSSSEFSSGGGVQVVHSVADQGLVVNPHFSHGEVTVQQVLQNTSVPVIRLPNGQLIAARSDNMATVLTGGPGGGRANLQVSQGQITEQSQLEALVSQSAIPIQVLAGAAGVGDGPAHSVFPVGMFSQVVDSLGQVQILDNAGNAINLLLPPGNMMAPGVGVGGSAPTSMHGQASYVMENTSTAPGTTIISVPMHVLQGLMSPNLQTTGKFVSLRLRWYIA
jgi:hypothetical protein